MKQGLEHQFDASFAARLSSREKQIQQSYRPLIGIHKWFARRPGTLFRSLLLSEFASGPLSSSFFKSHALRGTIADPFMGGGTTLFEANRLGFNVVGADVNPLAHWIVRESLDDIDTAALSAEAASVVRDIESGIKKLYETRCVLCGDIADAKYFLWIKTKECPQCRHTVELFPKYLLAQDERHPKNVLICWSCGTLNENSTVPTRSSPLACHGCGASIHNEGNVHKQTAQCTHCETQFRFLDPDQSGPLAHRLVALEYHCKRCKPGHKGRFFKAPDAGDLKNVAVAAGMLEAAADLPIPQEAIPNGDESDRLHRWGYRHYRELFNERQQLGLGLLLNRIMAIDDQRIRRALLTVFSDSLRYQNLLCRYDTYALKCQDIFSVHGFPVGLMQCENNLLGIDRIGSGSFRHFVEKYIRAKTYCAAPFEVSYASGSRKNVPTPGEAISGAFTSTFPKAGSRRAYLHPLTAMDVPLPRNSLDGVFTDPPYYDNVQYAELMDFCYVWLRRAVGSRATGFAQRTTRSPNELTGNDTQGRGLVHFCNGLSEIFRHFSQALKPGAPFVFTYHHNDPLAYLPIVVALLDAGLRCTAIIPAAAEMGASLHISGTGSSTLDSVFVCRSNTHGTPVLASATVPEMVREAVELDRLAMRKAGLRLTPGDLWCLRAGHVAGAAVNELLSTWNDELPLERRMERAHDVLERLATACELAQRAGMIAPWRAETYVSQVVDERRTAAV